MKLIDFCGSPFMRRVIANRLLTLAIN